MTAEFAVATTTAVLSLLCTVATAAASTNGDVNAHKYHIGQRCVLARFCMVTLNSATRSLPFPIERPPHAVSDKHDIARHSIIEDIYWDARRPAEAQRKLHQPSEGPIKDGGLRRLYDLWTPDYNCPFWKERVGDSGEGGRWVRFPPERHPAQQLMLEQLPCSAAWDCIEACQKQPLLLHHDVCPGRTRFLVTPESLWLQEARLSIKLAMGSA